MYKLFSTQKKTTFPLLSLRVSLLRAFEIYKSLAWILNQVVNIVSWRCKPNEIRKYRVNEWEKEIWTLSRLHDPSGCREMADSFFLFFFRNVRFYKAVWTHAKRRSDLRCGTPAKERTASQQKWTKDDVVETERFKSARKRYKSLWYVRGATLWDASRERARQNELEKETKGAKKGREREKHSNW